MVVNECFENIYMKYYKFIVLYGFTFRFLYNNVLRKKYEDPRLITTLLFKRMYILSKKPYLNSDVYLCRIFLI